MKSRKIKKDYIMNRLRRLGRGNRGRGAGERGMGGLGEGLGRRRGRRLRSEALVVRRSE